MSFSARSTRAEFPVCSNSLVNNPAILSSDSRYFVRLANGPREVAEALRLRHEVFHVELKNKSSNDSKLEYDEFDLRCRHLIVIERSTNRTVGTYRLNEIASGEKLSQLYSHGEFTIEDLPVEIWQQGIEIGRACVAREHRGTRALFLLWKALARHLADRNKRYCFGCCSIFTRDLSAGALAYRQLAHAGHVHDTVKLLPRHDAVDLSIKSSNSTSIAIPSLFDLYLRLGAKVCSPPMFDADFGTMDFFVVLDTQNISERYRKIFFAADQT